MSAWDGAQWGQPNGAGNNAAVASGVGGQYYDAATGAAPAPAAATDATQPSASTNTNGNANANNAANVPAKAGADSTTSNNDTTNAGTEAYAYGNMDPAVPAAGAPQAPQAAQAPEPPSAPQAQYTASPSTSSPPSRPWGGPAWKRPSWMGRYETISAMSNDDFRRIQSEADGMGDKQKREVEEEGPKLLERRAIEGEEAFRRREEKERRHLQEHLHRHVGMRKRGWWRS